MWPRQIQFQILIHLHSPACLKEGLAETWTVEPTKRQTHHVHRQPRKAGNRYFKWFSLEPVTCRIRPKTAIGRKQAMNEYRMAIRIKTRIGERCKCRRCHNLINIGEKVRALSTAPRQSQTRKRQMHPLWGVSLNQDPLSCVKSPAKSATFWFPRTCLLQAAK